MWNDVMRALLVALMVSVVLAGGWPAAAAQSPSDDQIYDQVRLRLANDRDVKGGGIEVSVQQGVVTLRGKVHEEKQKIKAERITRKVKGVKKVINELKVELGSASQSAP